jgi:hypothetical protein
MVNAAFSQAFYDTESSTRPDIRGSAVLHLMSHYINHDPGSVPCLKLASVIERHLKALADRSDLAPVLRATCQQMSEQWAAVVDHRLPPPPDKPRQLLHLLIGKRKI